MLDQLTQSDLARASGGNHHLIPGAWHSYLSLHFAWGRTAYADSPAGLLASAFQQPDYNVLNRS